MAQTGRILRFDEVRGYGFIAPDSGGEDVFVHANELCDDKKEFTPGTPVEFEVADGERGLKAFAVYIADRAGAAAPQAPAPAPARQAAASADDDGMCDMLSPAEYLQEVTESLLEAAPELTGTQIVRLRRHLVKAAQKHGWVEG